MRKDLSPSRLYTRRRARVKLTTSSSLSLMTPHLTSKRWWRMYRMRGNVSSAAILCSRSVRLRFKSDLILLKSAVTWSSSENCGAVYSLQPIYIVRSCKKAFRPQRSNLVTMSETEPNLHGYNTRAERSHGMIHHC